MKAFTDIEQSKRLAEILPLESADTLHCIDFDGDLLFTIPKQYSGSFRHQPELIIPSWSLAALLSVLPFHLIVNNQRYAFSMHKGLNKDGETYMFRYNVFNTDVCLCSTDYDNSPVDACYEMIIKLHEQNIL